MRAIREHEMTDRIDLILKLTKAYERINELKEENRILKNRIDYDVSRY